MPAITVYSSAQAMLAALRQRQISSVELTQLHIDRIKAIDGVLNAVPVRTFERALDAARRADAALAKGASAALLGLPVTLKESTQAAGLPQSAGILDFKDYRPEADGPIASSMFSAGACLLGKTNIPVALSDWQADSPVYGRALNPWDHGRTPGGSTGGGAAALASGMTPLEIGSDIGGSIRVPGAYCGIYGHRPSETAIPRVGSFPLADLPNPAALMAVQGPMARSAFDLELLFDVVAGPVIGEDAGWRLNMKPTRHQQLKDYRVAVMPEVSLVRPSSEMLARVDALATFLRGKGARVEAAMPTIDAASYFHDYLVLLACMLNQGFPKAQRLANAERLKTSSDPLDRATVESTFYDVADFMGLLHRRERARAAWREFFTRFDVLIQPTVLDVAFPHQQAQFNERLLTIDGKEVPYTLNIVYPMWAIFAGQPATAFPAGLSKSGLPLGLQAIGPYLEDKTTIRFAQLLEDDWEGFRPPPNYA